MAGIATISDVISVRFLQERRILIEKPQIEKELDKFKNEFNSDVRFHVDMSGKRAFVILSDNLLKMTLGNWRMDYHRGRKVKISTEWVTGTPNSERKQTLL